jgi:hypothetical protein
VSAGEPEVKLVEVRVQGLTVPEIWAVRFSCGEGVPVDKLGNKIHMCKIRRKEFR